ncbi:hypothetical protein OXX59_003487 [Metschnikowia pulcherrima]
MSEEHQILPSGDVVPQHISRSLFPHLYYIDPSEPNYEHYTQLIRGNGGHVTTNAGDISAFHLSSGPWEGRQTFSLIYIDHCLRNNSALPIESYGFHVQSQPKKRRNPSYDEEGLHAIDVSNSALSTMEPAAKRQRDKLSKSTTKFTPEADAYILEQVRMRPRFRTSHKFFEELAKHDMLKGHTGNSVRSRYRAHLEHKLQYVYKTDSYDNLILDEEGQKIPAEVSSAKTMKNKFTAEDDYHLCDDIIRHVSGIQSNGASDMTSGLLNEDKFSVSISFFDEYARNNPQHSSSSWRDRYRKFARPHGLQRYRDEYIRDCNTKEGPKPMRNMTSRKDRDRGQNRLTMKSPKDVKGKTILSKNSKNTELGDTAAAAVAALGSINMFDGHHSPGMSHLDHHMSQDMGMTSRESEALDEEVGEVRNSNIDDVLHSVGAGEDMSAIHPSLTGSSVDADVDAMNLISRGGISQDSSEIYQFLPETASINDVLSDDFFRQKPETIISKIKKYLVSPDATDLEKIAQTIEELGFTKKFIGHVMSVTSGSAMPMICYFEKFFTLIDEDAVSDVKDFLFIHDQPGFWTPQADDALRKGDLDSLKHMRKEDLSQRRYFLGLE